MQSNQMQALSGKELEYISDSISNEDLLIKQLAATAGTTQNSTVQDLHPADSESYPSHGYAGPAAPSASAIRTIAAAITGSTHKL